MKLVNRLAKKYIYKILRKLAQWVTDVTKLTVAFNKHAVYAPTTKKKKLWVIFNPTAELMLLLEASSDNKFTGRFDNLNV